MTHQSQAQINSEVARLVERAVELRLEGADLIVWYDAEELARRYNGLGPEGFPARLRKRASESFPEVLPAVLVHGVDFSNSDGSKIVWKAANGRFRRNCRACVRAAYPWWSVRRWTRLAGTDALCLLASSPAGWAAWRGEYERSRREIEERLERRKGGTER